MIPERFRSKLSDYQKCGYDRGHMAPALNHKSSQQDMDDTFFLTNMSPQVWLQSCTPTHIVWLVLPQYTVQVKRDSRAKPLQSTTIAFKLWLARTSRTFCLQTSFPIDLPRLFALLGGSARCMFQVYPRRRAVVSCTASPDARMRTETLCPVMSEANLVYTTYTIARSSSLPGAVLSWFRKRQRKGSRHSSVSQRKWCMFQVGDGFNRDYWARFERWTRGIIRRADEVYIATGPVFAPKFTPDGLRSDHSYIGAATATYIQCSCTSPQILPTGCTTFGHITMHGWLLSSIYLPNTSGCLWHSFGTCECAPQHCLEILHVQQTEVCRSTIQYKECLQEPRLHRLRYPRTISRLFWPNFQKIKGRSGSRWERLRCPTAGSPTTPL